MKQCPYCNAQIDDESKFCSECGKEFPQGNVCAYCGATVNEGDVYCEECGRNVKDGSYASADYGEKSSIDYMKILLSSLVGIVVGLVVLAVVGGSWYGYNAYSEYSAAKAAREKFVADSLEKARQDSVKLAAKQEAERLENEKIAKFREKFTFSNILELLKHPDKATIAQKCGLSLIYKDSEKEEGYEEGEYFTHYDYVYGYEVEKGKKNDGYMGYDIKASSNHSCYFNFIDGSDVIKLFKFKDKSDADYLFEMAKDYGLIEWSGNYYIPAKKASKGITRVEEYEPYDGAALFEIRKPNNVDGWYEVLINSFN